MQNVSLERRPTQSNQHTTKQRFQILLLCVMTSDTTTLSQFSHFHHVSVSITSHSHTVSQFYSLLLLATKPDNYTHNILNNDVCILLTHNITKCKKLITELRSYNRQYNTNKHYQFKTYIYIPKNNYNLYTIHLLQSRNMAIRLTNTIQYIQLQFNICNKKYTGIFRDRCSQTVK